MAAYCYSPLPISSDDCYIRLIKPLPGEDCEPVTCEIVQVTLDTVPEFWALSYAWGDPEITKVIQIIIRDSNGDLVQQGSLRITKNLFDFLYQHRQQRSADHPPPGLIGGLLWIDAISINQESIPERNQQVQMMREIYASAMSVIIWLGREDDRALEALYLIYRLLDSKEKQAAQNDSRTFPQLGLWGCLKYQIPSVSEPAFRAFRTFLERPWFSRTWIIQEVAVSKDTRIQCGRWYMKWADLVSAISYLADLEMIMYLGTNTRPYENVILINAARDTVIAKQQFSLLGLMMLYRNFKATNPLDKVFALCGLANDCGPESLDIQPDYCFNAEQVYRKVAYAFIEKGANLDVLSASNVHGQKRIKNLPSWVPDWSESTWRTFNYLRVEISRGVWWPNFQATPRSSPTYPFKVQSNEENTSLGVYGYVLDEISHISKGVFVSQQEDKLTWLQFILQTYQYEILFHNLLNEWEGVSQAYYQAIYPATKENMVDAYWKTLVCGNFEPSVDATKAEHQAWDRAIRARFRYMPILDHLQLIQPLIVPFMLLTDMISLVWNWSSANLVINFTQKMKRCDQRRMFRTKTGLIGIAPENAQCRDSVALLKGGALPFVLRAKDGDWELVGDCYVHGTMDGEAFDEEKCKEMWLV